MSEFHKDHHYVSRLYLKQWARGSKIATYRLLVPDHRCRSWKDYSLKGIAYHQHFYTYVAAQGVTDEFEQWLDAEFENPAEEAIQRAINDDRMTSEHWVNLIRFAAAQDARTPARLKEFLRQRENMERVLNESLLQTISRLKKGRGQPQAQNHPEMKSSGYPIKVTVERGAEGKSLIRAEALFGRKYWVESTRRALTKTINYLLRHKWSVMRSPLGVSWPTSDNPVIRLNFESSSSYDLKGGWGRKNGDIFLPLGPRHILHTQIGAKPSRRGTTLEMDKALFIQRLIIENADRYIFSREPFDVETIRARTVSQEEFGREQLVWRNWHQENSIAESEFL